MTTIRFAAFVLAAGALALPALAEDPPAAPATPAAPAETAAPAAPAPPAAPAAGMGRIYVSYPVQDKATYDANLAIDDLWIADAIKSGSCVSFDVPAGDHKLHTTTTPVWHVTVIAGNASYADLRYRGGSISGLAPAEGSAPANLAACTQGASPL
jgi:hypothetical protein